VEYYLEVITAHSVATFFSFPDVPRVDTLVSNVEKYVQILTW